jgi:DNA-binding MarR family transcriptional regulator
MVLLYISRAENLGRTVSEVKDHFDMSQSAASRCCRFLSANFNAERKGVDLVEHYASPDDYRIKYFRLNDNGRVAVSKMESDR